MQEKIPHTPVSLAVTEDANIIWGAEADEEDDDDDDDDEEEENGENAA